MDTLQNELQSTYPSLRIQLLGINERGQEAGNAGATAGRDLPWLQDVDNDGNAVGDVTGDLWAMNDRDLVILDGTNAKVDVFNLNPPNGLATAANYDILREKLLDAAMQSQKPWMNAVNHLDVDDNGLVVPLDVLLIVNVLNSTGPHELPVPTAAEPVLRYYDVNGDGLIAPLDALNVINFLNAPPGEGELGSTAGAPALLPGTADRSATAVEASAAPAQTLTSTAGNPSGSVPQTSSLVTDASRLAAVARIYAVSAVDSAMLLHRSGTSVVELEEWIARPADPLHLLNPVG